MSLRSMTGYGRGESRAGGLHAVAEIGSVNRRQFDLQLLLPRALQPLESRIQEEIAPLVSRGRITVNLRVTSAGGAGAAAQRVRLDRNLARAWLGALREGAAELKLADDLSASALLHLPDLFIIEHPEEDLERAWPAVREAVQRALKGLLRMRTAEGRALARDLATRLAALAERVEAIAVRTPEVIVRHRATLLARIERAGLPLKADDPSIAREIALFADRSDISEELTRLRSHLDQGRRMLREREPVGRALDFLTQELLREINTVASKCGDAEISSETVRFKAELERLREQVQNVE